MGYGKGMAKEVPCLDLQNRIADGTQSTIIRPSLCGLNHQIINLEVTRAIHHWPEELLVVLSDKWGGVMLFVEDRRLRTWY